MKPCNFSNCSEWHFLVNSSRTNCTMLVHTHFREFLTEPLSIQLHSIFFSYRWLCKSSKTWGCVTVHGFSDSVTSIGKSEKNFHKLCADSVTLVLSPSDRCWLFTDTWTPTKVYTLCFYITLSLIPLLFPCS